MDYSFGYPEGIILETLFQAFLPLLTVFSSLLAFLVTTILTIISLLTAYALRGKTGLFAIGLGWIAGFALVGGSTIEVLVGIALLILAVLIGEEAE